MKTKENFDVYICELEAPFEWVVSTHLVNPKSQVYFSTTAKRYLPPMPSHQERPSRDSNIPLSFYANKDRLASHFG